MNLDRKPTSKHKMALLDYSSAPPTMYLLYLCTLSKPSNYFYTYINSERELFSV